MSKKKNLPNSVKSFNIPLYGGIVVMAKTKEDYNLCRNFYGNESYDLHGINGRYDLFVGQKDGQRLVLVGVFNGKLSTLAHELFHITQNIAEIAGVADGEAQAYLTGFLMGETQEFFQCR